MLPRAAGKKPRFPSAPPPAPECAVTILLVQTIYVTSTDFVFAFTAHYINTTPTPSIIGVIFFVYRPLNLHHDLMVKCIIPKTVVLHSSQNMNHSFSLLSLPKVLPKILGI